MILTSIAPDQRAETLTGEYLFFALLGRLLYEQPEAATLNQLVAGEIFAEAPFAGEQPDTQAGLALLQGWASAYKQAPREMEGNIQSDYVRLFVAPGKLPVAPWESVYYTDQRSLFRESTMDVRRWYERFGLQVALLNREPDDHIGLELSFVGHLAQQALAALAAQDETRLEQLLAAQARFCEHHLLVWGLLWADLMVEHARTKYYRGLALLVRGALFELAALLELDLTEVARA